MKVSQQIIAIFSILRLLLLFNKVRESLRDACGWDDKSAALCACENNNNHVKTNKNIFNIRIITNLFTSWKLAKLKY